jgi:hypothetical protein
MGFRIAIGQCDCKKPHGDAIQRDACERIEAQLEAWQNSLPDDLRAVPAESSEVARVSGRPATFGISKHELPNGDTLVVIQAFVHTWSRPTHLSVGAVGRMYAEGLVVTRDGLVQEAPDDLMWEFR